MLSVLPGVQMLPDPYMRDEGIHGLIVVCQGPETSVTFFLTSP